MIIDQSEIDALLAQAETLEESVPTAEPSRGGPPRPTSSPALPPREQLPADLQRLVMLKVPVIVQLATSQMSIATVRKLSVGAIIEFNKSVDDLLDLLINNCRIGEGEAVKVNEHFGLRVRGVESQATRVRSMGRSSMRQA